MVSTFIIHGTRASPQSHWFPWLKAELKKLDCRVFIPAFPTPENQSLENWLSVFEPYKQYGDESSIVIGHSVGVAFLLTVLENLDYPMKAAFFVAGFTGLLHNQKFDPLIKTFVDKPFQWEAIQRNCKKFYCFHSDDDSSVPFERGKILAENLSAELIILKNAGHINEAAGYTKFDLLLEKLKDEL